MALTSQQVKGQKKLHFSVYKTALAVVFLASFEVQGIFDQDPKESEEGPESSFLRVALTGRQEIDITKWPCFSFNKESLLALFGTKFIKLGRLVEHVQFQNDGDQFRWLGVQFQGHFDQEHFEKRQYKGRFRFYYQRRGRLGKQKKYINEEQFLVFVGVPKEIVEADEIVGVLQWRPDDHEQIKVYLNNNRKRGDVGLLDVFVLEKKKLEENEKLKKLDESNSKLEEKNEKLEESKSKLEESNKKLLESNSKLESKLVVKEKSIKELKNELKELNKKDSNELNKELELKIRKHQHIQEKIRQLLLSINE